MSQQFVSIHPVKFLFLGMAVQLVTDVVAIQWISDELRMVKSQLKLNLPDQRIYMASNLSSREDANNAKMKMTRACMNHLNSRTLHQIKRLLE
jgi:hypothetical protein